MDKKFILVSKILELSVDKVKAVYEASIRDDIFNASPGFKLDDDDVKVLRDVGFIRNYPTKYIKDSWINEFTSDNNYSIIDVGKYGDSFFNVVRHAFNDSISVSSLREIISNKIDSDIYNTWKDLYRSARYEYNINIDMYKFTKNKGKKKEIERKINSYNKVLRSYDFISNIDSVEELKELVKTKKYFANEFTISTFRDELDVEFIIFDASKRTIIKNIDNNKKHYILVNYTGDRYQLITYKNKYLFTYDTIPIKLKNGYLINK